MVTSEEDFSSSVSLARFLATLGIVQSISNFLGMAACTDVLRTAR